MRTTISITLTIAALLFGSNAIAGNSNGCQGNCPGGDTTSNTYNQPTANAGAIAGAAAISGSSAHIGDVTNIAAGGQGGHGGDGGNAYASGGTAFGGNAHQGQAQQQGQSQTSVNGQSQSNRSETNTSTQQSQSSSSFNAGNAQNVTVEGDNYQMKRNAPGIVGGNVYPTASCKGGFSIGGSGPAGGGLLNIATTDKECQVIILAQNFQSQGRDATACKLLLTTKTWKRALKADPTLSESCK
jgi:hypothetical protein